MKLPAKLLACAVLFFASATNVYAEDDCDLLCQIGNWFSDLGDEITDVYWVVVGNANKLGKMTTEVIPDEAQLEDFFVQAGIDITDGLDSAACADLFADIPNFDPRNPTTNDFTNARLTVGIPLDFIKNAVPDDTFSAAGHTAALLPYYAYVWCEATLQRDMINADTAVRDGFHQDILDQQDKLLRNQARIEAKLDALKENIDARFDTIEALLKTPAGKREDWNK